MTQETLRVGNDIVAVEAVAGSFRRFGARFLNRIYSDQEQAYALAAPALTHQRLAARFAAKEAVIKILRPGRRWLNWRDIEVLKHADGSVSVQLHGESARIAQSAGLGPIALSLSHESQYATAVAVATTGPSREAHHDQ